MHIFTGDFNFLEELAARRIYKSFGIEGLNNHSLEASYVLSFKYLVYEALSLHAEI
jgi:hypothetical protein